jgi:hypothetical protein
MTNEHHGHMISSSGFYWTTLMLIYNNVNIYINIVYVKIVKKYLQYQNETLILLLLN